MAFCSQRIRKLLKENLSLVKNDKLGHKSISRFLFEVWKPNPAPDLIDSWPVVIPKTFYVSLFGSYQRYVHYLFESRIEMEVPKTAKSEKRNSKQALTQFSCLSSSGQMSQVLELIEQLSLLTRKNLFRSQLQIRDAVKVYSRFTPISNSRCQFERQFNYDFKLESWFEKWRLWKFS